MNSIITTSEVVGLAFATGEYIATTSIKDYDVAAAEDRYVVPMLGQALYEALLAGRYADLKTDYVAPVVAMGVRVMLQRQLNVRTGQMGLSLPATTGSGTIAIQSAADELQRSVKRRLKAMLKRLLRHLNENAARYPEYVPSRNPLNRCVIDGGIVQVR